MILLLVLALMSPYIHRPGTGRGNVILVLDTSGSMQHDTGEGIMRIEEAVKQARNLVASSEGTAFSIVTSDCMGTELLAVGVRERCRDFARRGSGERGGERPSGGDRVHRRKRRCGGHGICRLF